MAYIKKIVMKMLIKYRKCSCTLYIIHAYWSTHKFENNKRGKKRGCARAPNTVTIILTLRLLMSHTHIYIYIYIYMEHLFLMFLDHTQRRSKVGRTPLDE